MNRLKRRLFCICGCNCCGWYIFSCYLNRPRDNLFGDTSSTHGDTSSTYRDTSSTHGDTSSTHGNTSSIYGDTSPTHEDKSSTHGDTSSIHGDTSLPHGDTSLIHGDTSSTHKDRSSTHGNTSSTHGDTSSTQGDTSSTHGDTSSIHGDTCLIHGDTSSTNGDTSSTYGEKSSMYRDTNGNTYSKHRDKNSIHGGTYPAYEGGTSAKHVDLCMEQGSYMETLEPEIETPTPDKNAIGQHMGTQAQHIDTEAPHIETIPPQRKTQTPLRKALSLPTETLVLNMDTLTHKMETVSLNGETSTTHEYNNLQYKATNTTKREIIITNEGTTSIHGDTWSTNTEICTTYKVTSTADENSRTKHEANNTHEDSATTYELAASQDENTITQNVLASTPDIKQADTVLDDTYNPIVNGNITLEDIQTIHDAQVRMKASEQTLAPQNPPSYQAANLGRLAKTFIFLTTMVFPCYSLFFDMGYTDITAITSLWSYLYNTRNTSNSSTFLPEPIFESANNTPTLCKTYTATLFDGLETGNAWNIVSGNLTSLCAFYILSCISMIISPIISSLKWAYRTSVALSEPSQENADDELPLGGFLFHFSSLYYLIFRIFDSL